jgi:hypothetical protein
MGNMLIGFLAGLVAYPILEYIVKRLLARIR